MKNNPEKLISTDELKLILDATIELTKLKQGVCKHVAIENAAPEIFRNLIDAYSEHLSGKSYLVSDPFPLDLETNHEKV
jgi:hypothetical protein